MTPAPFPRDAPVAVLIARTGDLPRGAEETAAEAGGRALVVGSDAGEAATALTSADRRWFCDTGRGLRGAELVGALADALRDVPLILMPHNPDGRDVAPRLAAALDRPLLAGAVRVAWADGGARADRARLDDRLLVEVGTGGPAVATLLPGVRAAAPVDDPPPVEEVELRPPGGRPTVDVEVLEVLEPAPETMELGEATRVLGGGAGLVARDAGDEEAHTTFELLERVAGALGAKAGATRVVTDAGWVDHARQIGTTGVAIHPDLYVALGVSGAAQHVGGLGEPRHVVSVNTDPSCPMTAMADLGLVTPAAQLLAELARRLEVDGDG
ncbi:MAG TPA: mycofactocin-associated electron transfer flavoprotein alpha subunit [Solirubrobacteraceae bacterium]